LENFVERHAYTRAGYEEDDAGSVPYLRIYNRDRRLHIVDSNPTTCEFLGVHFRMEGFQVSCSFDSDHFLATLAQRCPDVVLINLQVGDGSGLDLLKSVRALRTGTPVFMLSDRGQLDAAVMAMKLGAVDVFSKPFDSEFLSNAVHDALRRDIQVGAVTDGRGRAVEVRGFSKLTAREREVLQLIAEGMSRKLDGR
jgi:two-component system response regulator FixJ